MNPPTVPQLQEQCLRQLARLRERGHPHVDLLEEAIGAVVAGRGYALAARRLRRTGDRMLIKIAELLEMKSDQ